MPKPYIKKGGHGGGGRSAGLPAGYWDDQGGRKAAGEAKARRQAEAKAKAAAAEQKARQKWLQWSVKAAPQQQNKERQPPKVADAASATA